MWLIVLSPSFGTYQLWSGNRHVVQVCPHSLIPLLHLRTRQVLSPGILGVDSQPLLKEPFDPKG
ncbi:hypothetical protein M3Y99_01631600 [Aphelenchoides fujianensis]|nr:hypothetical protein M3Y99_01631600 [Aphelenchoides fujianensis]